MRHSAFARLSLTTAITICVSGLVHADPRDSAAVERGRATFQKTCSVCHGDRADARTEAGRALKPPAANLRTLTKRYGTFPAAHVRAVITGQDNTASHSPAMRSWGAMLIGAANGDEAAAAKRLDDVIAFIESVQEK
jgi:mono/diheme cytochrome c family protein